MRKELLTAVFMVTLLASLALSMIPAMPVKANPDPVLVGRWHLDEGTGTIAHDSSGVSPPNDGTIYGATWTTGKCGGALSFDGIFTGIQADGDYVFVPGSSSLYITDKVTVEAWIKPTGVPDRGYGDVVCLGYSYELCLRGDGKLEIALYRSGAWGWWDSLTAIPIPATGFYHVAFTYDKDGGSNNLKIYINGALDAQYTVESGALQSSGDLWISPWFCPFEGVIDEVRIYNMQLYPQVIALHSLGVYGWAWLKPSKIGPGLPPRETEAGATLPLKFALYDAYGNFFSVPTGTIEMNLYKGTDLDAYGWKDPSSGGPRPAMGLPTVTYTASTLIGSTATSTFPHVSEHGSDYLLSVSSDTYIVNWHTNIKPDPDDYYLAVFSWATGTSFGGILTGTFYWWNTYQLTTE